jgi:para-nitrobenzyl esterase
MSKINISCEVTTEMGKIKGIPKRGVNAYLGIPYASPLGPDDRFVRSKPIAPWSGVLDATNKGPISPQRSSRLARLMGDFNLPYDEDSLTLDIWCPNNGNKKLPVLFWLHGCAFVSGAGSLDWYEGWSFAKHQEVIVIGVNYRLGALGFLCHPEISSGNMAIQDQILALEWVYNNIEYFGGDPENITIMGQSAGAISVYALLANKGARAMVSNAILQSGRYDNFEELEVAHKKAEQFASLAGVDVKALKTLPVEAILDAQTKFAKSQAEFASSGIPFLPVIDHITIYPEVHDLFLEGSKGKNIMLGSTRDEMHAWFSGIEEIESASSEQIEHVFKREFADEWYLMLNECKNRRPGASAMEIISMGMNISNFEGHTVDLARRLSAVDIKTWLYRFDWFGPDSIYGACHCIELPFVFDTAEEWNPPMLSGGKATEIKSLSQTMQKTWAAFVREGDPNHSNLPNWPLVQEHNVYKLCWNNFIEVIN